jgi:hypothetical protein
VADIRLYIDEQEVDTFGAESLGLSMSYSVADIKNPFSRSSSLTKTITLPATGRNKQIFGFSEDINSSNGIDQTQKPIARIEVEGTVVIIGFLKLTTPQRGIAVDSYECVIIGDNGDWLSRITDLDLTDLDFSDYDHLYNKANIDLSESTVGTGLEDATIVYPLINYGQFVDTPNVLVEDRKPSVNVRRLLKSIFNEQGYRVDSEFIDNKTDRLFRAAMSSNFFISTITGDVQVTYDDDSSAGNFDTGSNYSTVVQEYTVPVGGNYRFTAQITYDTLLVVIALGFKMHIRRNGVDITSVVMPFKPVGTTHTITGQSSYQYFDAGDIIEVVIREVQQLPNASPGTMFEVLASGSFWYNETESGVNEGELLVMNANLPDMSQVELVKGLKHLFNLYFLTNVETRTVFIEPFDDFVNNNLIDWSDKLDHSRGISIGYLGDDLSRTLNYRYAEDSSDGNVGDIQERNDIILGSEERTIDNKFANSGTLDITNPVFAPTLMGYVPESGFTEKQLPKMWNTPPAAPDFFNPEYSTKFGHRILYYNGVQSLGSSNTWTWEGTARTDFPEFYSVDEVNDNDNSLYFNDTLRSNGLFEKYYRNMHKTINEGRILTAWFNLNAADLSGLDFRRPIQLTIDGETTVYRLNRVISYNPTENAVTKVELSKIVADVPLATVTTVLDSPNILPPSIEQGGEEAVVGIVATINGVTTAVLVEQPNGLFFQVFKNTNAANVG